MTLHSIDTDLIEIFQQTKTIALIGASIKPNRASYRVGNYLADLGYHVIPINPDYVGKTLFGHPVVATLQDIENPKSVDMIDIFRRTEFIPDVVNQAIQALPNLQTIWMQLDLMHDKAAMKASNAGIMVVQDRCPKIEYPRLQELGLV